MTDRRARLAALVLVFASVFCAGVACRMAFGAGATPFSRVAGGMALAIDAAAVFMNALAYLVHCHDAGPVGAVSAGSIPAGVDGDAVASHRERPVVVGTDAGFNSSAYACETNAAVDVRRRIGTPAAGPTPSN